MKKILKTFSLYCLSFLFWAAMNACQNDDVASIDEQEQEQESNSESLTAVISDGLHSNWSEGDPIMLVHNGQTIIAEPQEPRAHPFCQVLLKELSLMTILCLVSIRQITGYLQTMKV